MSLLFDEESNKLIRKYMKEYEHIHNRFVLISKLIPKYKPNQLSNYWNNYLDPRLCLDPLTEDEKIYIIEHVQSNRRINGLINWKLVVNGLKVKFGKLRSENRVRNFWNSKLKSDLRKAKRQERNSRHRNRTVESVRPNLSLQPKPCLKDIIYNQQNLSILPIMEPYVTFNFNTPIKMNPVF
ncbi:hypothetical protein RclHR1_02630004 [Rhizophagus clarus]|uniref:Kinase-like domain-containing protein n=1 Tax=Rhizophagus clarus TaxID=94130 RepID=A0A2Z6RE58_9GLOM|nr:hypothetical protein RclHR1_02630004 [Rhizophagus clarus]GET03544.1 kinase-like domain-containing protein [Rhizophagus clarus]